MARVGILLPVKNIFIGIQEKGRELHVTQRLLPFTTSLWQPDMSGQACITDTSQENFQQLRCSKEILKEVYLGRPTCVCK